MTARGQSISLASRYRSLFVVGKGGMGSVEAALQNASQNEPERVVALKRLLPDAARDRKRVDMFLREAKVAAMLDHPNVVTAYDFGELDGELYLAMEYVEGQPLSRVLRVLADAKASLPISLAAYVLAEICRGLHAAHELTDAATKQPLNLVHRDVSPQNVMLGYDGRVRLLDFGVAKIETESVTKTGEVKGKTAYMSPEQAMGDPLDRRSDLFGVGALLFECLALRRMWGDGTDMDVIRKLALESPPTLAKAGRDDLPAELVALHERLVARDRDARPATAAEVAKALDAFVLSGADAQRELASLLAAHFAEQEREQRARLDASLNDVAPAHASALRESLLPSLRPAARASDAGPSVEPPKAPVASSRSGIRIGAVSAALVVAAIVAWKMLSPPAEIVKRDPLPAVSSAVLPAMPQASEAAPTLTAPPASASIRPMTSASAAAVTAPTVKIPMPVRSIVAPLAAPAPSARPIPVPSAKPPDIDDKPF